MEHVPDVSGTVISSWNISAGVSVCLTYFYIYHLPLIRKQDQPPSDVELYTLCGNHYEFHPDLALLTRRVQPFKCTLAHIWSVYTKTQHIITAERTWGQWLTSNLALLNVVKYFFAPPYHQTEPYAVESLFSLFLSLKKQTVQTWLYIKLTKIWSKFQTNGCFHDLLSWHVQVNMHMLSFI